MTASSEHEIVVYLWDGRAIDISGRSPKEAVQYLRTLGVTADDIKETVHRIRRPAAAIARKKPA